MIAFQPPLEMMRSQDATVIQMLEVMQSEQKKSGRKMYAVQEATGMKNLRACFYGAKR